MHQIDGSGPTEKFKRKLVRSFIQNHLSRAETENFKLLAAPIGFNRYGRLKEESPLV